MYAALKMEAESKVSRVWLGHCAMLGANMVWGAMSPITKNVLETGVVDGLTLSAIRIIGATLIFVVLGFVLPSSVAPKERIAKCDRHRIFIASILMITMNQGLYIIGISYTTPVDSAVMSTLTPVFTMICAAIFLKFPITWLKGAGVVLGLAGALMIVAGSGSGSAVATNPALGDSMCLVAQLCAALYYVLFRDLINKYSPFTMMKWMFICSACTFGVAMIPELLKTDFASFSPDVWMSVAYIIVFATFISYLLIPFSQQLLKPTAVSMYTYFQPVTSGILAALMGYAVFGPLKILATLLIFAGVFAVIKAR